MKQIIYSFINIERCNMCGSLPERHKILGKRLNKSQGKNPKKKMGITTTILICKNCQLIFSNPQPVPCSIQDHYGVSPTEYWNEDYFQVSENYFQEEINELKTLNALKNNLKSLDIGSGVGKTMIALSRIGYDAHGLEPSETFYQFAIERMKIQPEKLMLGSIENTDYPENYFDFISFGAVLEHLYNPASSIEKAIKWLKPGGVMHIEVPSSKWLVSKLINLYYFFKGCDYVCNISPMHPPYHLYEFSLKSFITHSRKNNYEIVKYNYFVCQTYLPKFFDFFIKPYMKYTKTGMQLTVWLRKKKN